MRTDQEHREAKGFDGKGYTRNDVEGTFTVRCVCGLQFADTRLRDARGWLYYHIHNPADTTVGI